MTEHARTAPAAVVPLGVNPLRFFLHPRHWPFAKFPALVRRSPATARYPACLSVLRIGLVPWPQVSCYIVTLCHVRYTTRTFEGDGHAAKCSGSNAVSCNSR